MEAQQEKVQKKSQAEEDVLDFDLEDISLEDIDAGGKEEEIIELTELVERGMPIEAKEAQEVVGFKEDHPAAEQGEFELGTEDLASIEEVLKNSEKEADVPADVADFTLELEESPAAKKDLKEGKTPVDTISHADLEEILKEEEPLELISEEEPILEEKELEKIVSALEFDTEVEKPVSAQPEAASEASLNLEESAVELPLESDLKPFEPSREVESAEGLQIAANDLEPLPETPVTEPPPTVPAPQTAGISEEKLEAIVTRVVQDVVERVAREAMASVAERVIGEAIESLKKSLAETPER